MRKLSTIIYSTIIALGITACSNNDNDIFGESSAQRLNRAIGEYSDLLQSSESGWAMEYFANEKEKGYTFLVQFRGTGGVTMAVKDDSLFSNKYTEAKSLYEIIADNGPVLTFNTYNTILHYFSNPEGGGEAGNNGPGRGHEGDYEFIVMKTSNDLIELQGKKRGYGILLRRLPAGQDWREYFAKLENVKKSLFSTKISTLWFTAPNGEKYSFNNPYSGVFNAVPEGGDPISQTVKVPFLIGENGIRLMKPFKGNNEAFAVQSFAINEEGYLANEEGNARITASSPITTFCDKTLWMGSNKWNFIKSEMGGKFKDIFAIITQKSIASFKSEFDYSFKNSIKVSSGQSISFRRGTLEMGAKAIIAAIDENNAEQIKFTALGKYEAGWANLVKSVPEAEDFVTQLTSTTYTVHSTAYALRPTVLKLVSTTDPNDYLTVSVE